MSTQNKYVLYVHKRFANFATDRIQLSSSKLIISTVVLWRFISVQVCRWVKQSSVLSVLSNVSDTVNFKAVSWCYVLEDVTNVSWCYVLEDATDVSWCYVLEDVTDVSWCYFWKTSQMFHDATFWKTSQMFHDATFWKTSQMFHAFPIVSGYRMHEISKRPTAADPVPPLFHLKKDTVSVSETLWVLSLTQWTVRLVCILWNLSLLWRQLPTCLCEQYGR